MLEAALKHLSVAKTSPRTGSPWYNRAGWLGVKHQVTYLLIKNRKSFTLRFQERQHLKGGSLARSGWRKVLACVFKKKRKKKKKVVGSFFDCCSESRRCNLALEWQSKRDAGIGSSLTYSVLILLCCRRLPLPQRRPLRRRCRRQCIVGCRHNLRIFGVSPFFKLQNNT